MDLAIADLGDNSARGGHCADRVGDTELGRVLVLSSTGNDDLDAVVGNIRLQGRGRGPNEFTGVGEIVGQAPDGDNVSGWAAQEDNGYAASGGGLRDRFSMILECLALHRRSTHVPCNGEGGTNWHDLVEARRSNGVSTGGVADWCLRASRGCRGNASKGDETSDSETHID